jgi:hypothetical protein
VKNLALTCTFNMHAARQSSGWSLRSSWQAIMDWDRVDRRSRYRLSRIISMKSVRRGRSTSVVEVGNVSAHGFWLLVGERERFLSFADFPWFRDATIAQLTDVELPSAHHLYWPQLDVDLAVEAVDHPERYPLVSRATAGRPDGATGAVKERRTTYKARGTRRRG